MKNTIKYIDCGAAIWITKEDWETLKLWFKTNKGGQELEEFQREKTVSKKARRK